MAVMRTSVKLPAFVKSFRASYSRVSKPTGVEYTLLTIIGTESLRYTTWGRAMEMMGIPEDLSESMFWPALREMERNGMIMALGIAGPESLINLTSFTALGEQAYEKGVIAQSPEEFAGRIANRPAELSGRYMRDSDVKLCGPEGFDESRFEDIMPDDDRMEDTIIGSKGHYGIGEEMEVFDVRIEGERTVQCYSKDISVRLNDVSGSMYVEASGLDENFLKARFRSEDIIGSLKGGFFESSSKDASFVGWRQELPEWDSMSFMMPCDVKFNGHRFVFVDGERCVSSTYPSAEAAIGCDIVTIDRQGVGAEYCLVERDIPVEGMEGSVRRGLVVRRTIGPDRISEIAEALIGRCDISMEDGFNRALALASVCSDTGRAEAIVRARLESSVDLAYDIRVLKDHRKDPWYRGFGDMVEQAMVTRGMDPSEVAGILYSTKVNVNGFILADHYYESEADPLGTVDELYDVVTMKDDLVRRMGAEDLICGLILSCTPGTYTSKLLSTASNMAGTLGRLKERFGMRSLSDYSFDIEGHLDESEDIVKDESTFSRDLAEVSKHIRDAKRLRELGAYGEFFSDACSVFRDMEGKVDPRKCRPRTFGIIMGALLEKYLSAYVDGDGLGEKLINARDQGMVSEDDYTQLDAFRRFRNQCAHEVEVGTLDKKDRTRWTRIIENLNPDKGAKGDERR